jgi:hypothetical protein
LLVLVRIGVFGLSCREQLALSCQRLLEPRVLAFAHADNRA